MQTEDKESKLRMFFERNAMEDYLKSGQPCMEAYDALSHIERLGHFDIDNYSKIEDSWQIIKDTIERMNDEELRKLDLARRND